MGRGEGGGNIMEVSLGRPCGAPSLLDGEYKH